MLVYKLFADLFGGNVMFKHNKFVDNGVSCSSGHHMVPITENLIMIKTSITDGENESKIVFQVAYNLCKYVIYAMNAIEFYERVLLESSIQVYIDSVNLAKNSKYDLIVLSDMIYC